MLINALKIALRNVSRQKSFTALNIAGLAVGVAAVLLIFQIVQYELSYNKNFSTYDRVVRMVGERNSPESGQTFQSGSATSAMIAAKETVPQFEATSRVRIYRPTVIVPDPAGGAPLKKLELPDAGIAFFAEPGFFQIFDYQWLAGDKSTVLNDPGSIVLSRETAQTCFDNWQNAIGKTILLNNAPMTVRGIMEDAPDNCDFPVKIVLSYATLLAHKEKYDYVENWGRNRGNDQFYALLSRPDQFAAADAAIGLVGQKEYAAVSNSQQIGRNQHFLQPLANIHYDTRLSSPGGLMIEKSRLWILSSIGLLVLLMACFNFVNLTTAQALQRAKEVGVRKTLGGGKTTLIRQFLSETALVVFGAVSIGTVLTWAASPVLSRISALPENAPFFANPLLWCFLGGLALIVTFLSGFYPALVMAGFSPVRALKNEISNGKTGGATVRKGLVVIQFAIAQALIIGTIISLQQMNFIQDIDLGFKDDLVYIFQMQNTPSTRTKFSTLKTEIQQVPGVESMTFSNLPPASRGSWQTSFSVVRGTNPQPFNTSYLFCDEDFQKTFGVELLAGKWFGPSDTTTGYIINETLMRKVGITSPEAAVGQELRLESDPWYPIVGVVKDFHSKPLQAGFEPLTIGSYNTLYVGASVKISPQNMSATLAGIKKVFDDTYPEQIFSGVFFDESIARFYAAEERFSQTCKGFALLAVLISCLGLFGLAAHAAQRRTKEIGVRKVLGATVASITGLLAKDFLRLVLLAVILASPPAWYFMQQWLANFEYHVEIRWWIFAVAGVAALLVAFLTVSFQSVKAALMNPVKSLRSE